MTPEQEATVHADLEQLRSVLTRLVAVRVSPDGPMLDQHEGSIMISFGTLMFLATDLRETRMAQSRGGK